MAGKKAITAKNSNNVSENAQFAELTSSYYRSTGTIIKVLEQK